MRASPAHGGAVSMDDVDSVAVHQRTRTPVACGRLAQGRSGEGLELGRVGGMRLPVRKVARRPERPHRQATGAPSAVRKAIVSPPLPCNRGTHGEPHLRRLGHLGMPVAFREDSLSTRAL